MKDRPLIVVGVDGSPDSDVALGWALELAASEGADLEAVRAWQWDTSLLGMMAPQAPAGLAVAARRAVESQLKQAVDKRPDESSPVTTCAHTVEGDAAFVLLEKAVRSDLLVLGRHGHAAWQRLLPAPVLGSVTSTCLSHSTCPVAVVPPAAGPWPPSRIVVGIDGSGASSRALHWAIERAGRLGAPVLAVLAWQLTSLPPPASARESWSVPPLEDWEAVGRELLSETVSRVEGADMVVQRLLHRPAAAGLLETVRPDDLLVLGDRGRGGFTRLLLGSVTRQCAEHAPCPVVVVPPRDRGTH